MIKKVKYLAFLIISMVIVSCVRDVKTNEEMSEYITDKENGLVQTKVVNNTAVQAAYRPSDLIAKQYIDNNNIKDELQKDSIVEAYNQYMYFVLSFKRNNTEVLSNVVGDKQTFGDMLSDMAFHMQDYVFLITPNKDTFSLLDFSYPRTYGLSGSNDIIVAFDRPKLEDIEYVNIYVKDFGIGTGNLTYKYLTKDINNTPTLVVN